MYRTTLVISATLIASPAFAVDGVIEINHAQVLAGGITPGDAPGYPATLSVPGSYRLTGMLVQPDANTVAIQIAANEVSIDLNGFGVRGPVTCSGVGASFACTGGGTGSCIEADTFMSWSTVRNGSLVGCGLRGVDLNGYCTVEGVRARNASNTGIQATGTGCRVSNSTSNFNGHNGVSLGSSSHALSVAANSNASQGISAAPGSVLSEVTAYRNGSHGITARDSVVSRATAASNTGVGIFASGGTVQQSVTTGNTQRGIDGAAVHNCRMTDTSPLGTNAINVNGNICGSVPCP